MNAAALGESGAWMRAPLAWGYALGRRSHRAVYQLGLRARRRLPRPVICVGNLTVGGTGKSPFLICLARQLQAAGRRPAILSRGYRAQPPADPPRVVSDGESIETDPRRCGDEPIMLARALPGVPVVIGTRRYAAGRLAIDRFDPDCLLLDDGFQHEALARDADLVLWDLRDRPRAMRQLPAGRLREGLGALRRAAAIILTHGEYLDAPDREERASQVTAELKRAAPPVPIFEAAGALTCVYPLSEDPPPVDDARPSDISELKGKRVLLFTALARPAGFEKTVRDAGADVAAHVALADHADFDPAALARLTQAWTAADADLILTTEKDAVKLGGSAIGTLPIHVARWSMSLTEPERWKPFLQDLLPFNSN